MLLLFCCFCFFCRVTFLKINTLPRCNSVGTRKLLHSRKVLRRDSNTVQTRYEVKLSTNPNRTKCPRPHPLPAKPPYQKPGRRRFAMCSNHPDTPRTTLVYSMVSIRWRSYSVQCTVHANVTSRTLLERYFFVLSDIASCTYIDSY